jgi:hypothetical protein
MKIFSGDLDLRRVRASSERLVLQARLDRRAIRSPASASPSGEASASRARTL